MAPTQKPEEPEKTAVFKLGHYPPEKRLDSI